MDQELMSHALGCCVMHMRARLEPYVEADQRPPVSESLVSCSAGMSTGIPGS